jgi:hypothetical protein
MDKPPFALAVVGTAPAELVDAKLGELLKFKLYSHHITLHAGPGVRRGCGFFGVRYSLAVVPVEDDPKDSLGTTRNTELLRIGDGFLAFGPEAGLSPADADLLYRARNSGRGNRVRVV